MTDLIELVAAVDGILQMQAAADADYFAASLRPAPSTPGAGAESAQTTMLKAYRWQYIVSGACRTSASRRSSAA